MGNISKMIEKMIVKVKNQNAQSYPDVAQLDNSISSYSTGNVFGMPQERAAFKKGGKVKGGKVKNYTSKAKPC
tara:strand:+ start:2112 stop:2330 length:219 start_codon:yes stop_codon:yes gene_type:complete